VAGGPAHLCLPWAWCQRLAPAAAPLLREARAAWAAKPDAAAVGSQPAPPPPPRVSGAAAVVASAGREGGPAAAPPKSQQQQQTGGAVGGQQAAQGAGPLLLFPDTSALLAMLGCRAGPASSHCPLTMRDLEVRALAEFHMRHISSGCLTALQEQWPLGITYRSSTPPCV